MQIQINKFELFFHDGHGIVLAIIYEDFKFSHGTKFLQTHDQIVFPSIWNPESLILAEPNILLFLQHDSKMAQKIKPISAPQFLIYMKALLHILIFKAAIIHLSWIC